jgi:hypothetical protein
MNPNAWVQILQIVKLQIMNYGVLMTVDMEVSVSLVDKLHMLEGREKNNATMVKSRRKA